MSRPHRLAVLLSGSGTTLQNLLDRCADGSLPAEVVLVLGSNPTAKGVDRARAAGIAADVVDRKTFASRTAFSEELFDRCRGAEVGLVCLAGFLQLVEVPDDFAGRVLNIHPSLIPAFCGRGFHGMHVHRAVLEAGVKVTGCTVHFADNEYDHGPIVLQRVVDVLDDDIAETLAARVFAAECQAYPEAIRLYAEGRLVIDGRRVRIKS